jgi:hypothetical protein
MLSSACGMLLRRVVLDRARVAAPLARELRRRGVGASGGALPASRRSASASVEAPAGGAGGAASPLSSLSQRDADEGGVTAEERAAAAAELAALAAGGDEEEEEEEEEESNTWVIDTPRGRKELVLQGGVMLEPDVAERLQCRDNAKISSSEFVKSSVTWRDCPPPKFPEFAFIGRSNVGKSSLINCLTARKSLAMVSKTPGARSAAQPAKPPQPPPQTLNPLTHMWLHAHPHTHTHRQDADHQPLQGDQRQLRALVPGGPAGLRLRARSRRAEEQLDGFHDGLFSEARVAGERDAAGGRLHPAAGHRPGGC